MAKTPALQPGSKVEFQVQKVKSKLAEIEKLQQRINDMEDAERSTSRVGLAANNELFNYIGEFQQKLLAQKKILTAKLKELKKQQQVSDATAFGDLANTIAKSCSLFIAEYKKAGSVLYRGAKGPKVYLARPRDDRKPMTSDKHAQIMFDKLLAMSGIKALRSNSIFATSDIEHASSFGSRVYVIFPRNGSQFSYTNLTDAILDDTEEFIDVRKVEVFEKKVLKYMQQYYEDPYFDASDYIMHNDIAALQRFLTKIKYPVTEVTLDMFMISPDKFIKTYQPRNTNLRYAITKSYEVLISGEYYAVDAKIAANLLPLLGLKVPTALSEYIYEN